CLNLRLTLKIAGLESEKTKLKSRMDTTTENAKLKTIVVRLKQDSRQPQNDLHFEEADIIPESIAVQLKQVELQKPYLICSLLTLLTLPEDQMENIKNAVFQKTVSCIIYTKRADEITLNFLKNLVLLRLQ
ncbi:8588_t:CDS:1, partial [Gigaspora margarita]